MKFIHFGCWNNGNCSTDGANGLSLTMNKLNSYIEEKKETIDKIEFIVIAGDNYYPPKGTTKKFIEADFISGFKCLPEEIPKYLIFGNHDIEDVITDESGNEIKCKTLTEQINFTSDKPSFTVFNEVLFKKVNNTLIIMLDTNLYNIKIISKPINQTCYSRLFNGLINNSTLTLKDLIDYQNLFIENILKSNSEVENIIFIGHHPIYAIKAKKDKDGVVNKAELKIPKFIDFFKDIKPMLSGKQIYYLCADTHIYQQGIVKILPDLEIKQYIVGTAGAPQDAIYTSDDVSCNTIEEDGQIVYRKSIEKKEFGFLTVDINDLGLSLEFISVNPPMLGGGMKRYKIKNMRLL
jgi:hypothetical protein